jgi:hypothetical protein
MCAYAALALLQPRCISPAHTHVEQACRSCWPQQCAVRRSSADDHMTLFGASIAHNDEVCTVLRSGSMAVLAASTYYCTGRDWSLKRLSVFCFTLGWSVCWPARIAHVVFINMSPQAWSICSCVIASCCYLIANVPACTS